MAAAFLATDEQIRTEQQAHEVRALQQAATRARSERLREAIARHVAGTAEPSNFEAMCDVIRRDPNAGPDPCEDCDGRGFRLLPEHAVEQYRREIASKIAEIELMKKKLRATPPDAQDRDNSYETRRLLERIRDTGKNLIDLREELEVRSICRRCRGSSYAPRKRDSTTARPDSMWTTVSCPRCRGVDRRRHPLLATHHHGSSTGQLRLEEQRFEHFRACAACGAWCAADLLWFSEEAMVCACGSETFHAAERFPVQSVRNDAAAEHHDQCPACLGSDGLGRGYLEPISIRPMLKTSNVLEDPNGDPRVDPEKFPETDFVTTSSLLAADEDGPDPEDLLGTIQREDPVLAAAIAVYHSPHAYEWDGHPWGRSFALWPLTDAGRRFAEQTGHLHAAGGYEGTLELCRGQRLAIEEGTVTDPLTRALERNAKLESRALEARVKQAIDEAVAA